MLYIISWDAGGAPLTPTITLRINSSIKIILLLAACVTSQVTLLARSTCSEIILMHRLMHGTELVAETRRNSWWILWREIKKNIELTISVWFLRNQMQKEENYWHQAWGFHHKCGSVWAQSEAKIGMLPWACGLFHQQPKIIVCFIRITLQHKKRQKWKYVKAAPCSSCIIQPKSKLLYLNLFLPTWGPRTSHVEGSQTGKQKKA